MEKNKTKAIWEKINKAAGKGPQYVHKIEFYNETDKNDRPAKGNSEAKLPPPKQELHINKMNSNYLNCQMS
jgi:hypothetical protein